MSDYRSDLRAAEERIEQLEALLTDQRESSKEHANANKKRRASFSVARVIALVAVVVPLIGVFVLGGLFVVNERARRTAAAAPIVLPPITPPPIPGRIGIGWYASTSSWHTTSVLPVKLDDGRELIVGLAMNRGDGAMAWGDHSRENRSLYAVAVDRATWKLVWHRGPFPSLVTPNIHELHHIVVKDNRVVVTDAKGAVHILDASDGGNELFTHQMAHGGAACLDDDTHNVTLVAEARYWSNPSNPRDLNGLLPTDINRNQALFLDTKTGKTKHAALLPVCGERYCSKYRTDGCSDLDERPKTPSTSILGSHVADTWRDKSLRVSVGKNKTDPNDGVRHAVGWDAKTRAIKWETRIEDPSETFHDSPLNSGGGRRHRRYAHDVFDNAKHRFISVYPAGSSALRLVALDTSTGERLYDVEVPNTSLGTEIRSFSVDRDDVFLIIDDELRVFDARTGSVRARIEELTP